jgi:hypothetical protein
VEIVFVQLTNKTGEVAVLEVLWEDMLCEFLVLDCMSASSSLSMWPRCRLAHLQNNKAVAFITPPDYILICRCFQHPTLLLLWIATWTGLATVLTCRVCEPERSVRGVHCDEELLRGNTHKIA